jgi:putative colanic acid biosynthesis UDP-glucose lipid carrier transferase
MKLAGGSLQRHATGVGSIQRLADGAMIILAQILAHAVYLEPWRAQTMTVTVVGLLVYSLSAEANGLYRPWRMESMLREIRNTLVAWLPVPLALLGFWFFTKTSTQYSRVAAFVWFVFAPLFLCTMRISVRVGLRILRAHGHNARCVAILGCTADADRLAEAFDKLPWLGLRLHGVYDDRSEERRYVPKYPHMRFRGNSQDLLRECREGVVDVVYVALPLRAELRTAGILTMLSDTTAAVYLVADFLSYSLLAAQWTQVGDIPVVGVHDSPFSGIAGVVKRLEDLILGSAIVLFTAIPMICIAFAVKISSPGPIIFRQWRYGLSGRKIRILKFRTMKVCEDGPNIVQASKNDPRITRVGRFLRRTSLDEFPQFLQVVTGELSLVGPRPHAVAHNEQYRSLIHGYMLRHIVKPGITGWAQINGLRGETAELSQMTQRVEHDLEYIRNWNLMLDLKIIFRTIFGVVKGRNAW